MWQPQAQRLWKNMPNHLVNLTEEITSSSVKKEDSKEQATLLHWHLPAFPTTSVRNIPQTSQVTRRHDLKEGTAVPQPTQPLMSRCETTLSQTPSSMADREVLLFTLVGTSLYNPQPSRGFHQSCFVPPGGLSRRWAKRHTPWPQLHILRQ